MIVTIDGPAGAGKSTVAKRLARRLGFQYLDTGAMYRAVALAGLRRNFDWNRPEALADLAAAAVDRTGRRPRPVGRRRRQPRNPHAGSYRRDPIRGGQSRDSLATGRTAADHGRRVQRRDRRSRPGHRGVPRRRVQNLPHGQSRGACPTAAQRSPRDQGEAATLEEVLEAQQARDHRDAVARSAPWPGRPTRWMWRPTA